MRGKDYLLSWPVFVLFLLLVLCTTAAGEVIYVDDDATGANDGSSWENAFTDLQNALIVAVKGDEIRVAQGIYTPTQDPLDRDATFDLKDDVSITGGYAGLAGMYPDFRHTEFYTTILSGDIDNNDNSVDPNNKNGNSHHVVTCTGPGNAAILEGITITGGFSNSKGGRGGHGYVFGRVLFMLQVISGNNYYFSKVWFVSRCEKIFKQSFIWQVLNLFRLGFPQFWPDYLGKRFTFGHMVGLILMLFSKI